MGQPIPYSEHTLEEVGRSVGGYARTYPADRSQGAAEVAASFEVAEAAGVYGWGAGLRDPSVPSGFRQRAPASLMPRQAPSESRGFCF